MPACGLDSDGMKPRANSQEDTRKTNKVVLSAVPRRTTAALPKYSSCVAQILGDLQPASNRPFIGLLARKHEDHDSDAGFKILAAYKGMANTMPNFSDFTQQPTALQSAMPETA